MWAQEGPIGHPPWFERVSAGTRLLCGASIGAPVARGATIRRFSLAFLPSTTTSNHSKLSQPQQWSMSDPLSTIWTATLSKECVAAEPSRPIGDAKLTKVVVTARRRSGERPPRPPRCSSHAAPQVAPHCKSPSRPCIRRVADNSLAVGALAPTVPDRM